jgi:hypothetical protein
MVESSRPEPRTARRVQDLKDLAKDLAPRVKVLAKDLAGDVADGYRRSTRHVRMRAAVIGTWAVLSLGSLWIACPRSGPTNALGAEVHLLPESIVGPQVLVQNGSDEIWTNVVFTLDGTWRHARRTVRPQDKLVLAVAQFAAEDGAKAPRSLRPATIRIECEEGRISAPLEPERTP